MLERAAIVVLWLLVIASGLVAGGSIVERVAIIPLWAAAPPESVRAWTLGAIQRPFFEIATPIYALLALAAFVSSWFLPAPARPWARTAGVVGVALMIATVAVFVPALQKTQATGGAGLSGEEIVRLTRRFVDWSWLRTGSLFAGWLAALRALTRSH
jgi:hypothetical protein